MTTHFCFISIILLNVTFKNAALTKERYAVLYFFTNLECNLPLTPVLLVIVFSSSLCSIWTLKAQKLPSSAYLVILFKQREIFLLPLQHKSIHFSKFCFILNIYPLIQTLDLFFNLLQKTDTLNFVFQIFFFILSRTVNVRVLFPSKLVFPCLSLFCLPWLFYIYFYWLPKLVLPPSLSLPPSFSLSLCPCLYLYLCLSLGKEV